VHGFLHAISEAPIMFLICSFFNERIAEDAQAFHDKPSMSRTGNDDLVAVMDKIAERPASKGNDSCWLR
jgi:hypothetical protein